MAQPLSALPHGAVVNYTETIGGVPHRVQYKIHRTAAENPYGSDCCLMLRLRVTGRGQGDRFPYGRAVYDVEYQDSLLDAFCVSEYASRFDEKFLRQVKWSEVRCHRQSDGSDYVLQRQFFAPSCNELGGHLTSDPSEFLDTFQSFDDRVAYLRDGETRASYRTRSPASDSTVCYVYSGGGLYTSNPTYNNYARPSFNLDSSILVASEPNEDGSYDLLIEEEKEFTFDVAEFESNFALLLSL